VTDHTRINNMPTYFPDEEDASVQRRRAGLRADELLPGESNDDSAGLDAAGTPGGGLASGGLAGTNAGDGSFDDADLADPFSSGLADANGDKDDSEQAEAGHSGGAVGGTPVFKRAGRAMHDPR
jgi:hypothetical protein